MRLLLLLITVSLYSCSLKEICDNRFPPSPYDSISIRDSIVWDSIPVWSGGNNVAFDTISPCDPKIIYVKEVKKNGLTGTVKIKNGKLSFECKSDSLMKLLVTERHDRVVEKSKQKVIYRDVERKKPWYESALEWMNIFWLIFCFALFLAYKWK